MEQEPLVRGWPPRWHFSLLFTLGLVGFVVLTAWNLLRSKALFEAQRAYAQGELTLCLRYALDHLGRRPWNREAALLAARCLSRLDYAGEAEPYFQRAGPLSLNDAQIRAYGLVRGPSPERAVPVYNEILARSPENVTALRRLAAFHLARNNTEELLKLAERLSHIPEGAVIGATLRGVVHHNQKNRQEAVAAFERVLELDPQLREMPLSQHLFWSHLADDLLGSGRIADARRCLSQVLEKTADAGLMSKLGHTYFLEGALDDAERCFRQAAEWDPSYYAAHLNLAKLQIQRQNGREALKHLEQARALAPRQRSVLYNLVSVYRQLGRAEEAERVQKMIDQLREQPASSPGGPSNSWPRYAL